MRTSGVSPLKSVQITQARIRLAEERVIGRGDFVPLLVDKSLVYTSAPRQGIYSSSDPVFFLRLVRRLRVPSESRFLDTGSGLGGICFAAATVFRSAVGIEADRRLFNEAELIRSAYEFGNVKFVLGDFLSHPFQEYDVIHIFHPFLEGFERLMAEKMKETKRGAVIIANIFLKHHAGIFPRESFYPFYIDRANQEHRVYLRLPT